MRVFSACLVLLFFFCNHLAACIAEIRDFGPKAMRDLNLYDMKSREADLCLLSLLNFIFFFFLFWLLLFCFPRVFLNEVANDISNHRAL